MSHETNWYTAEEMTAYLDGDVSGEIRDEMAAYFASHDKARAELEQLRATVLLVGQLPPYRLRRSFTLGNEHASARESSERHTDRESGAASSSPVVRWMPVAQWVTIAAVAMFVALAGFGYVTDQFTADETDEVAAPEPAAELPMAVPDEDGEVVPEFAGETESEVEELGEVTKEDEALVPAEEEPAEPQQATPEDDPLSSAETSASVDDEGTRLTPFLFGLIAVGGVALLGAGSWLVMRWMASRP